MGNLKTLRGLLVCIAFLESTSTNSVNVQCQDRQYCVQYKFPLMCEGKGKEWYLRNCPKSCKACPADQLSKTYVDTSTLTLISSKSTIREERNVTDVNKASGVCKDDNACTHYRDFHHLCSGTDGWYRKHCRLSCNMCTTDQVSVTREISHTSTTSPVKARHVIVQVHDDVSQATSPITANQVSVQEHDDVSLEFSYPERAEVTTWIPSPAGAGQNMERVMTNEAVIAITVLTPILVIVVIVIIVISRIKGRKVVLTPQREQPKVVVTYSGLTPQPEEQAYTTIDLEAHTYSSVDDIKHETEDYQNISNRGSHDIDMNQEKWTSDSKTVDCTLYQNAGKKISTEDTDINIYENKSK